MNLPDFLTECGIPGIVSEIRVAGHRIGLYTLIRYHTDKGYSAERLAEEFDTLPLALINQVLDFYQKNQAEVDEYMTAFAAELDRQEAAYPPSPAQLRIRRLAEERLREQGIDPWAGETL
jgi:uncharacterized protein (DUF433 family)